MNTTTSAAGHQFWGRDSRATTAERILSGFRLYQQGEACRIAGIRAERPSATDEEVLFILKAEADKLGRQRVRVASELNEQH